MAKMTTKDIIEHTLGMIEGFSHFDNSQQFTIDMCIYGLDKAVDFVMEDLRKR